MYNAMRYHFIDIITLLISIISFFKKIKITQLGSNLSLGEKQMVSITRTMLRRAKIVLVDEPSSNIDEKMEQLITEALNETFAQCTVLTIAHKIKTIMTSDKIMVVDKGEVVEFDTPKNLLENSKSNFFKIVKMIEE